MVKVFFLENKLCDQNNATLICCYAIQDKQLRQNEVNALRKQIEKEYQEKVKLEDDILEKLRTQLTMDKASHYTDKLTGKLRRRTKDMVTF